MRHVLSFLLLLTLAAPGTENRFVVDDDAFIQAVTESAKALHKDGKLVSVKTLRSQLDRSHCELKSPPARTEKLRPREIYRMVKNSTVAVAAFYQCTKCKD